MGQRLCRGPAIQPPGASRPDDAIHASGPEGCRGLFPGGFRAATCENAAERADFVRFFTKSAPARENRGWRVPFDVAVTVNGRFSHEHGRAFRVARLDSRRDRVGGADPERDRRRGPRLHLGRAKSLGADPGPAWAHPHGRPVWLAAVGGRRHQTPGQGRPDARGGRRAALPARALREFLCLVLRLHRPALRLRRGRPAAQRGRVLRGRRAGARGVRRARWSATRCRWGCAWSCR